MLQGDYVEKWYVKLLTVTSIKAVDSPSYLTDVSAPVHCLALLRILTVKDCFLGRIASFIFAPLDKYNSTLN